MNRESKKLLKKMFNANGSDAILLMTNENYLKKENIQKLNLLDVKEIKRDDKGKLEIQFIDRLQIIKTMEEFNTEARTSADYINALVQGAKAINDKYD